MDVMTELSEAELAYEKGRDELLIKILERLLDHLKKK